MIRTKSTYRILAVHQNLEFLYLCVSIVPDMILCLPMFPAVSVFKPNGSEPNEYVRETTE